MKITQNHLFPVIAISKTQKELMTAGQSSKIETAKT